MQRYYTFLIILLFAFSANAQINEVPISSNPILEKEAAKEQQRIEYIIQQIEANHQSVDLRTGDFLIADGICLLSGETLEICIDTIGQTQAGSTLNFCDTPSAGSATFLSDTSCVVYVANSNVAQMSIDSLCVEFCDGSGMCDTTIYPIIVHRPNNTTTLPVTNLNVEESIDICPTLNLPGDFSSSQIISNDPQLGAAYTAGECIFYESQLFAGMDTVIFEVCDNFCVCDTYLIPFNIEGDTMSLPFMDDFSYDGPYPDKAHWLDRNVFVNNTMALNPVSVGVATFDGLNSGGRPIGGGYGSADVLTSAYLDLSTGSDIFLSFYVQPKGLGDTPAGIDSLVLEFKNSFGDWVEIASFTDALPSDEFSFFAYPIAFSQYLYNGFQFRFRNFSKRTGNIDHWHLDYVRVLSNTSNSSVYPDVAFTHLPNSILKNYTSMPWWQFVPEELQTTEAYSEVNIYNHFDNTLEIVPGANQEHTITEALSATPVADDQLLDGGQSNITVGANIINSTQISNGFSSMQTGLTNFPNFTQVELERTFTYPKLSEEPSSVPAVSRNNTVTRKIIFDNYFSYDDNTAETGIEASKKNTQIALKFHANVADTLKAVQIHFPHIVVNTSSQLFNLKVWVGELDDEAEYNGLLQKPLYIDSYTDSLNGLATYVLTDPITGDRTPLAIPAGDFYIGWQQVSDCDIFECIAVGNDKNNPQGMENVLVDATGSGNWIPVLNLNPSLEGSLMIRAVVGAGEPEQSSNTEDLANTSRFSIFPNPTNGFLNIEITNGEHHQFDYLIYNNVGQLLENNQLAQQIDLQHLQNGIYFVKIMNKNTLQVVNHKIIIAK